MMEEVDSIILHFLRQLNVHIEDNIKNLCELRVETIIESASKCLSAINLSTPLKIPTYLPSGVSQRIEIAALIASACKDLGYKSDVGYQTFLYYNETELRQVFMFLIEKLPSEDKKPTPKSIPSTKKHLLMQNISNKIAEELNTVWIPPCCKTTNKNTIGDFNYPEENSVPRMSDNEVTEKLLKLRKMEEINLNETVPLREEDKKKLTNETKVEQEKMYDTDKSLKELKETTIILKQKLDSLESERNVMNVEYSQVQKNYERAEADFKNLQNILNNIGVVVTDSDDFNLNLSKVHTDMNKLHVKSEELTSRNLSLKSEINKVKKNVDNSESERSKSKKILQYLKETAKSLKEECVKKGESREILKCKYDKLKGGNKRHIYTKRILEIIGNVDKQNMEIKKILEDTRHLQKEINTLEGQLDRCFSIADETLFKDAKKDDQAKKAYKLLALLHSECNTIVTLVNDTGTMARDIVDLEDNIKAEKSKRTEDILQKIQTDLAKLQKESS